MTLPLEQVALIPRPRMMRLRDGTEPLQGQERPSAPEIAAQIRESLGPALTGHTDILGLSVHAEDASPDDDAAYAATELDPAAAQEAYHLQVTDAGATLRALTETGRLHAVHTLAQLLWNYVPSGQLPHLAIHDWPSLTQRGIHVCYHLITDFMPDMAPNFDQLWQRIALLRHYKGNLLLLELESLFPYREHPAIVSELAFSRDQWAELATLCREEGVEVLPLVQCLGHAYNVLRHPEYAHLREVPETTQQYCPTNPDTRDFYLELVDELCEIFPEMTGIHIGGDESRRLGVCARCREKAQRQGMGAVYGEHVGEICRRLLDRGLTPYVWADMIEHMPDVASYLPEGTVLVYWNYDILDWPREPAFEMLKDTGLDVVTASAARFGTHNHTMYLYSQAMRGIGALTRETRRHGLSGTMVTDWMKAVPQELSNISLFYGLEEAWNGTTTLADYEEAYGQLHFGLPAHEAASVALVYRLLEPLVPFSEDAQARLLDHLDRFDLSSLTMAERIARYVGQREKDKYRTAMEEAWRRGEQALEIMDALVDVGAYRIRELEILRLSAKTQLHKARMGLAFMDAARILRYPLPDDDVRRAELVQTLEGLLDEWEALRAETRELLTPGTFAETVDEVVDVKFEPEAKGYMTQFRDLLAQGETVAKLL